MTTKQPDTQHPIYLSLIATSMIDAAPILGFLIGTVVIHRLDPISSERP